MSCTHLTKIKNTFFCHINIIKSRIYSKNIIRGKEGYLILIKWSIQQEDITILSLYALNNIAAKYVNQTRIEIKEKHKSTIIAGNLKIPLLVADRTSKKNKSVRIQKI